MNQAYQQQAMTGGHVGYDVAKQATEPEVNLQMMYLNKATERLAEATQRLIDRLGPVSQPNGSQPGVNGTAPQPVLCSMATAIRDVHERINRYATELEGASGRLQI